MRMLTAAALAAMVLALPAGPAVAGKILLINGAGATFPYPIYSKWFAEYAKVNPDVNFNYQSIGSGGGIRQITAGTVDFGATDGPMSDEQLRQAPGALLHLPTVLGGVVCVYNVPGVSRPLDLTRQALAEIFIGKATRWNDPVIAKANPDVKLPSEPIIVVHRSDGSGTSFIWTDFLSKVSPAWAKQVGKGTSVSWPVGLGGKGNEGVAGLVKQTPHSIGYVELGYAQHNKIPYARIENAAGKFVECTLESVTQAAAATAASTPADFRVSITDPPGDQAYPVASYTWLLVYGDQADATKGRAMKGFLTWMLRDGQAFAGPLGYAPLPADVIRMVETAVEKITVAGE
jgi:phosphate transport system substrate-binding protein